MNFKKSIESRVRGWFPQEPKLTKAVVTGNVSQTYPPIEQYLKSTKSATKNILTSAIIFGVVGGFSFVILDILIDSSLGISELFWILTALTVGLLIGSLSAQSQLKQLAKTNQVRIFGKHFKVEIVFYVLFAIAWFLIGIQLQGMRTPVYPIFLLLIAASYCSKYMLFTGYEKRRNVIIRQQLSDYVIDPVMFALPKPTKSNQTTFGQNSGAQGD